MNASEFLSQLWRRRARRTSSAPRKTQRLTGFEPLEPRTVLSASTMPMFDVDGLAGASHNLWHSFAPGARQFAPEMDAYQHSDLQPFAGPRLDVPAEVEDGGRDVVFGPNDQEDAEEYRQPQLIPASPAPSPSISAAEASSQISTSITIVTTLPLSGTTTPLDLYVTRPQGAAHVAADYGGGINGADIRFYTPVNIVVMLERRSESQPYSSSSSYRESSGYVTQVRVTPSTALAAEADEGLKAGEHALSQHASSSPALSQFSISQSTLSDRTVSPAADEGDRAGEQPANSAEPGNSDGDGDDGLIELQSVEASRQKRKFASSESAAGAKISPRLERLAELSFSRSPQFDRELARLGDDNFVAADRSAFERHDDGLIELLASDVGTLMAASAGIAAGAAAGTPVVNLEGGVAFYQAFDIALTEVVSADAPPQDAPRLPDAPASDQLARAE